MKNFFEKVSKFLDLCWENEPMVWIMVLMMAFVLAIIKTTFFG